MPAWKKRSRSRSAQESAPVKTISVSPEPSVAVVLRATWKSVVSRISRVISCSVE